MSLVSRARFAASAVALLALLTLHAAVPAHARKMLQSVDQATGDAAPSGWDDAEAFDENQDGAPFDADSDALAASWSRASPVRQVAATEGEVLPPGEDEQGEGAAPDDGLFDEESPSQPIVTAVDPGVFLEPPSFGSDDNSVTAEVADEDLFDEDTPEVPIVTAVNPDEFIDDTSASASVATPAGEEAEPSSSSSLSSSASPGPGSEEAAENPVTAGALLTEAPAVASGENEDVSSSSVSSEKEVPAPHDDDENPQQLSSADLMKEPTEVTQLVKQVVSYSSDCVPENTAVLVQVNYHHIPLFHTQVKDVIRRRCFMRRYVLLALDGKSFDECRRMQGNGVELHCAKSQREEPVGNIDGDDVALSKEDLKAIMFERWTVVADVLQAMPNLKLWVFDADVVIFKVPTLALPAGCDFSTQLDKLEALGAATEYGSYDYSYFRRLLQENAATPTLSLVPHVDRGKYSINGGQVVLQSSPAVIAFLRAVGEHGENEDFFDYLVMTDLIQGAAGEPWESMTSCDLPESFSSACWGLAVDPFTFHANCVDRAEEKLREMHNAVALIASAVSPSTGGLTLAEGYPDGTSRYCWDMGTMCVGNCVAGKLCNVTDYKY